MEQGQKQELEVIVYNSSDEDITVGVSNNSALTNSNGLIVYEELLEDEELHESMEHPFSEISTVEETNVDVAAREQETVVVTVEAPDENFDGVILGGLYFSIEPEENDGEEAVMIQNTYSYALAIQIQEADNENTVNPNIELLDVDPGVINYRTGLQTEFVNTAPIIVSLEIEGSVYEAGEEDPLYTRNEENFTVAPNSKFKYPVMYENQRLEAGDYIFKATVKDDSQTWEFEETFEVTEEEADEANDEAVELVEEENNWLIYIVIALSTVILLLLVTLTVVLKRKK